MRVVTITDAFIHIKGQLEQYKQEGKEIILVSANGNLDDEIKGIGFRHENLVIKRDISPIFDLVSVIQLIILIRRHKPNILHSSTPKAGIVCALAGFLALVPVRIHTFTGQRWATLKGPKRLLLKMIDRLIVTMNTRVYSDSESQNQYLIEQKIVKPEKIFCIHKGSLGGIDIARFSNSKYKKDKNEVVYLFLGRINKDKGIEELISAFNLLVKEANDVALMLVGPNEMMNGDLSNDTREILEKNKKIKIIGSTNTPEKYIGIADVLCLPSYREGFGTVVIEAASMGVPAIGTKIPGLVDSIVPNKTGLLVEKQSVDSLFSGMLKMYQDSNLRTEMGNSAYRRAKEDFSYQIIAEKQWSEYISLLAKYSSRSANIS